LFLCQDIRRIRHLNLKEVKLDELILWETFLIRNREIIIIILVILLEELIKINIKMIWKVLDLFTKVIFTKEVFINKTK
jgi:hypothetical protein